MFSATTANQTRHNILNTSQPIAHYNPLGLESLETPGTSHMDAADASGMVVSLTTTINMLCGSQVIVPETGIVLNDEMNDFSIPNSSNLFGAIPAEINFATPGKRPLSSMAPTIVDFAANSTFYMAVGGAGGSRAITTAALMLWHVLDQNMTTYEALHQPRFHDMLAPAPSAPVIFEFALIMLPRHIFAAMEATSRGLLVV